jgi:hypothetical protein
MNNQLSLYSLAKGPFMKMVLQIPVEGGHEGGRSKVELNDQVRLYNVCDGSDRNYYLTTFYSDCEHIYEEVKFGYRLTMQFELELETNLSCPPCRRLWISTPF